MESMPSPCFLTTTSDYAPKHNPFVYFDDIRNNTPAAPAMMSLIPPWPATSLRLDHAELRLHHSEPVQRYAQLFGGHGR